MKNKCKICGNVTTPIQHERLGMYHYCSICEFIGKDERFVLSATEELEIYNIHNNSIDDPLYVAFFNRFLEDAVFPFASDKKDGFDFGSGPSPVLAQLLERDYGYQMDIYDPFYAPEKIYLGKKYNLITSTEVVEHLKDPLSSFRLLKDLLNGDSAILSIITSFHQNNEAHFKNWHYTRDETHIAFYTPKTMEYIAKIVGLKLIHTNGKRYTTFKK